MSKVYVVTKHVDEDRHIIRVFSSKERAEVFTSGFENDVDSGYAITECDLDLDDDVRVRRYFRVIIEFKNGTTHNDGCSFDESNTDDCDIWYNRHHESPTMYVNSPISYEHALSVAIQKRQDWLSRCELEAKP